MPSDLPMKRLARIGSHALLALAVLTAPAAAAEAPRPGTDAAATLLRALYSPDQLRERLTWFWFNPFTVHQAKGNLRAMVGDYVDTAIRPHALGRFRDLLAATLRHSAMLRYLDNAENAAGRINENYARELMELRTMGVGIGLQPDDPKLKPERRADLIREGLLLFNPNRHDYGDKRFLGHDIRGRGFSEEIGAGWSETVVVVLSEFGRTFRENGNRGTDHGHGSVYWVLGGGLKGGRIAGPQVRVGEASLFQNRDYPVLTDHRALLADPFGRLYGLGPASLGRIFAEVRPTNLGLL